MSASVHDYLRQRRSQRQKRKFYFFGSLAATIVIAVFYFIFFSGIFTIRGIDVVGADVISVRDVQAVAAEFLSGKAFFVFPHENILLFSSSAAAERVREVFPRAANVSVEKNIWRRKAVVTIEERNPAGVACVKGSDQCVYFDASGVVFATAPIIASASLLRIEESALDMAQFPQEKYAAELVQFIMTAKKQMQEKAHATIVSFAFINGYGDIEARTQEGFTIFLNTAQGAEEQAQIIKNIIAAEIKDQMPLLEYIDLRVENRAYYKLK